MFTKKPENFTDTERLLYLILQELKRISTPVTEQVKLPELPEPEKPSEPEITHTCKKCGEKFSNVGKLLVHMKKSHPKGGVKDGK